MPRYRRHLIHEIFLLRLAMDRIEKAERKPPQIALRARRAYL